MLENLLNLVKEHAGEAIINNPAIPNEKNEEAIKTATEGIMNGLKSQIASGGMESLTSLFNSGASADSPAVQAISGNVAQDLMKRFNLDSATSGKIVQMLIPVVMSKFIAKTNDQNDSSFDIKSIASSVLGKSGGVGGMIGGLFK